jgi:hypothetical protein
MILLFIYIYIEKKVFYNIEGQLRGVSTIGPAKNLRTTILRCYLHRSLNICTRALRS